MKSTVPGVLCALSLAVALASESAPVIVTFDNCSCKAHAGPASRGVNAPPGSGKPARWVEAPPAVPAQPTRRTVVTYSIVTAAAEVYVEQTLQPILPENFIGAETLNVIRQAAETWNFTCGIVLQHVESNGQIRIGSGGGSPGIASFRRFGNPDNSWYITEAYVQISSTATWTPDKLRLVVAHEVGHAIGLKHTDLTDALMFPTTTTPATSPTPDDRWYGQSLYGAKPAGLMMKPAAAGLELLVSKASPVQTGTNSDPTFEGSAPAPLGPGTGSGAQTQSNVLRYVIERRNSSAADFTVLNDNLLSPDTVQNAEPSRTGAENSFVFSDTPADGAYIYRVKAVHENSADDIYSREVNITVAGGQMVDQPPLIESGPSAAPSVVLPGDTVSFSVSANDPEGESVTASWSFGDGTPDVIGFSVSHAYAAIGIYTATVTITAGGLSTSSSVSVEVVDQFPFALDVTQLQGAIKSGVTGRDTCSAKGVLPGFVLIDTTAVNVMVNVGGATHAFVLDVRGKGKSVGTQFTLKRKRDATSTNFTLKLKGTFSTLWADENVVFNAAIGSQISMPVEVQVGSTRFRKNVTAPLTSKAKTAKYSFRFR